ncbi:hypothetical protein ACMD2_00089 [Ananas comosus]|uniref:Uncharacterized protein n=2 Tax=Ananas comosus TaxID=4615 RepID=A0A199VQ42_ANACO|nr:hypothetical protein ACMD2_00089 [Ananas comosus]CAD1826848.1 unnamed protein product [Ananas comosus var. bracteatus]
METEAYAGPLDDAAAADAVFARRRCCCFWIPWTGRRPAEASSTVEWWERIQGSERLGDGRRSPSSSSAEGWWWRWGVRATMKVREWSELVAGPRWKTFIRRFNRNPRHGGGGGGGGGDGFARFGSGRFQYDPLSYALNFDEGHGWSPEGDYSGYRDFSARFAAPPASAKGSMDLGGRDAPPLFGAASPRAAAAAAAARS